MDGESVKIFSKDIDFEVLKKIDFSDVSFDNANISRLNFSGFTGVKINPQTVAGRNLSYCDFEGVEFTGSFDHCTVYKSSFKGSKGVKIDISHLSPIIRGVDFTDTVLDFYLDVLEHEEYNDDTTYNGNKLFIHIESEQEEYGKVLEKIRKSIKNK